MTPARARYPHLVAAAMALVAIAISQGVQVANGNLHPVSIKWLTVACVATILGGAVSGLRRFARPAHQLVFIGAGAALAWEFFQLSTVAPGVYLQPKTQDWLTPFHMWLAAAAVLAGGALAGKPWLGKFHIPALVAVHFMLGVWLIQTSPNPHIDVFMFQKDSAEMLLHGTNPYSHRFPDIYGNGQFYPPGLSENGILHLGYPYPPLSLFFVLPAHGFFGDYRYAQLTAMGLAALLMAFMKQGQLGRVAAALYLFSPRWLFVLEQGWTEPLVVFSLAVLVFALVRKWRVLPYLVGAFLVVKQYLVLAIPLFWLVRDSVLPPRAALMRWGTKVVATGALLTLPMALWDFKEFWHSVVECQFNQPFRVEAMSYLALYAQDGGPQLPSAFGFLAAGLALAFSVWRMPRTAGGFAAGFAMTFLFFFAFNKQAFCNYYFLVIGAACVALATLDEPARDGSVPPLPQHV